MRRKHRKLRQDADLDITAFMNLMIVLVPILLINMIFAHTTVLELNFPSGEELADSNPEMIQLQVIILDDKLVVADDKGGVIKQLHDINEQHDYNSLARVMQDIKSRIPGKKDITIMAKKQTSYQTLVTVMDTVRSYRAVIDGNMVNAELFPEISIADAPEIVSSTSSTALLLDEVDSDSQG